MLKVHFLNFIFLFLLSKIPTIYLYIRGERALRHFQGTNHRVSIEGTGPYNKESYTVNSHQKMFGDVFSDVGACVGLLEIRISS